MSARNKRNRFRRRRQAQQQQTAPPERILTPLEQEISRAYSQERLARILTLPEYKFGRAFGMETVRVPQKRYYHSQIGDYYHFRDNGSSVLAVAHLDTVVHQSRRAPFFSSTSSGPAVRSGALDDRLGAYVILKLLPAMGITHDWLLTTGEESCASTAAFFRPQKDYDWLIEFDRMGTDVVMYQYEDEASRLAVEAAGAEMGHGSYSDIASLEELGVKGFNWGVGYRGNYHSENGYAFLHDTFSMAAKYLQFHEQNAGTAMPHEPDYDWLYGTTGRRYDGTRECELCSALMSVDPDTGICSECNSCNDCYMSAADCQCYTPDGARNKAAGHIFSGYRIYDSDGYDSDGYDQNGYDRDGRDIDGYDRDGYDEDGYSFRGWHRDGYHRNNGPEPVPATTPAELSALDRQPR